MQRDALALALFVDLVESISSLDPKRSRRVVHRQRRVPLKEAQGEGLFQTKAHALALGIKAVQVEEKDNAWSATAAAAAGRWSVSLFPSTGILVR